MSADLWGVRREILPWLQYHTELGVTRFYVSTRVPQIQPQSLPSVSTCNRQSSPAGVTCSLPLPLPKHLASALLPQLLYDGADPTAVELLSRIRHVRLMHLHEPWASAQERAAFEFYSQQAKQWAGQPGNYELMVKQGKGELMNYI